MGSSPTTSIIALLLTPAKFGLYYKLWLLERKVPWQLNTAVLPTVPGGQASKGSGWMPRRPEPRKGVASCEKPR